MKQKTRNKQLDGGGLGVHKPQIIVYTAFVFLLLASVSSLALDDLMGMQGTVLNSTGSPVDGNVTFTIYDATTGGTLVYNSSTDFNNKLVNGEYDIVLGSGTQELTLDFGRLYYLDLEVNGEDLDFQGSERQQFQAQTGEVYNISGRLNVSIDNETLFVDSTNNRVGIGRNRNLSAALDIVGSIINTGNFIVGSGAHGLVGYNPLLYFSADGNNNDVGEQFIWEINNVSGDGAELLRLNESGLTSNGTITADAFVGDGSGLTNVAGGNGSFTTVAGNATFTGGNVGVGTTTPGADDTTSTILQVSGSSPSAAGKVITTNSDNTSFLLVHSGGAGTDTAALSWNQTSALRFLQQDNPYLGGTTNERMRIDSSGNVGIGTTAPQGRLHVVEPANIAAYFVANNTFKQASNDAGIIIVNGVFQNYTRATVSFSSLDNTSGTVGAVGFQLVDVSNNTGDFFVSTRLENQTIIEPMRIVNNGTVNFSGTVNAQAFVGDGSGLTGITASGSLWNNVSGAVTLNGTNVSIGTEVPLATLDIRSYDLDNVPLKLGSGIANDDWSYLIFTGMLENGTQANFVALRSTYLNQTANFSEARFDILVTNTSGAVGEPDVSILANGSMGIGTTTPSTFSGTLLEVQGHIAVKNDHGLFFLNSTAGDPLSAVDSTVAGAIQLRSYNSTSEVWSDLVIIHPNGSVGVGTTSPIDVFEVVGGVHSSGTADHSRPNSTYIDYFTGDTMGRIEAIGPNATENAKFRVSTYNGNNANRYDLLVGDENGNVGINTSSPNSTLTVAGTVSANAFVGDGSQLTGVTASSDVWNVSNGHVFLADSDDNVSIGTSSPGSSILNVVRSQNNATNVRVQNSHTGTNAGAQFQLNNGEANAYLYLGGVGEGSSDILRANRTTLYALGNGGLVLGSMNESMRFYVNGTANDNERMIITQEGFVGIGVLDPDDVLEINGTEYVQMTLFSENTTGYARVMYQLGNGVTPGSKWNVGVRNDSDLNNSFVFENNLGPGTWVKRVAISPKGEVGIGTTSPRFKLHVVSDNSTGTFDNPVLFESDTNKTLHVAVRQNNTGSGAQAVFQLNTPNSGAGTFSNFYANGNGTRTGFDSNFAQFTINSGDVGIGTTNPVHSLHLVDNVNDYENASIVVERTDANDLVGIGLYNTQQKWDISNIVSEVGDDFFGVRDSTANNTPFRIEVGSENSTLVVDATSKVGIGVEDPTSKLHVNGNVTATKFFGDGSELTGISSSGALWTNTSGNLTFVGGNVGIGKTNPNVSLDVVGAAMFNDTREIAIGNVPFHFRLARSINDFAFLNDQNQYANLSVRGIAVGGNYGDLNSTPDEGAIIQGDVGIGTPNPARRLHVNSTVNDIARFSGNNSATDGYLDISYAAGDNIRLSTDGTATFGIRTNVSGGDQLFINGSGNVGIGTTTPQSKLDVEDPILSTANMMASLGQFGEFTIANANENGNVYQYLTLGARINSSNFTNIDKWTSSFIGSVPQITLQSTTQAVKISILNASTGLYNQSNFGDVVVIHNDGNTTFSGSVGVGTTTPDRNLHVNDVMKIEPRSAAPTGAALGDIYVDSDTFEFCFYNSTHWTGLRSGGTCA